MQHNPPLSALRTFISAANNESFARAAQELSVTSAAISQQIKKLETYLGITLFHRLPQGLELTAAGASLLPQVQVIFDQLDDIVGEFVGSEHNTRLTVSVAPVFACKWLVPRLGRFHNRHPEINLRITSSFDVVDFTKNNVDAAIRLSAKLTPGLVGKVLFQEMLTPLCAPSLIENTRDQIRPEDLQNYLLLHDESFLLDAELSNWATWLKMAGTNGVNPDIGPYLSQPDHVFQAAINGIGFMLGWRNLASDDIAQGKLVQPFELALPMNNAFRLVYPIAHARRKNVQIFQNWLLEEIRMSNLNLERT